MTGDQIEDLVKKLDKDGNGEIDYRLVKLVSVNTCALNTSTAYVIAGLTLVILLNDRMNSDDKPIFISKEEYYWQVRLLVALTIVQPYDRSLP